jgi:hypothetical protein
MARYIQTVLTGPVEGADDEFNRWYDGTHLREVLSVPGFVSARRFASATPGEPRYLAIYEIETDDLDATLAAMAARAQSLTMSDALDRSTVVIGVYEVLGERREA